ncbi:hypothetical protein [Jiulongibacter sp. NS-SX5]|uniref:hypothetical protein n=1 Tax=Jiulongibacter sp. NS-SX5 TaxID=3463854 RepID=UPI0040583BED
MFMNNSSFFSGFQSDWEIVLLFITLIATTIFISGLYWKYHLGLKYSKKLYALSEQKDATLQAQGEFFEVLLNRTSSELINNIAQILSVIKLQLDSISPRNSVIESNIKNLKIALDSVKDLSKKIKNKDLVRRGFEDSLFIEASNLAKELNTSIQFERPESSIYLSHSKRFCYLRLFQLVIQEYIAYYSPKKLSVSLQSNTKEFILVLSVKGQHYYSKQKLINNHFSALEKNNHLAQRVELFHGRFEETVNPVSGRMLKLIFPKNRSTNHDYRSTS